MSTRRQSDWGNGDVRSDNPLLGSSPSGASEQLFGVLQNFIRLPGFGKMLSRGKAGDLSGGVNGGIDMDRVNRSVLGPLTGSKTVVGSFYTITTTTFTDVDTTYLTGRMACTGRPVIILLRALLNRNTSNLIAISASVDGSEVTGTKDGMASADVIGGFSDIPVAPWFMLTPAAGVHRFSVVASVDTGSGQIWSSVDDLIQMVVMEI